MAFVVFHVSAPYKSTEFTFELKIFIFVPLEMFLALHQKFKDSSTTAYEKS
jgi:hypothetical protein